MYPIGTEEDTQGPVDKLWSRPRRRRDSHEEALWKARTACQRALEAAQVLKSDIERLSWGMRDVQQTHPCSHSRSHLQSHSLDRQPRSPSRPQQERLNQTLRRVGKVIPQSPPSRILKPGWIGRPTNWIFHVGGQNLQPSQG